MCEIEKILCPLDFSEAADKVCACARHMAVRHNAELIALNVVPHMHRLAELYVASNDANNVIETVKTTAGGQMDQYLKICFKDLNARGVVLLGDPADEILNTIDEEGVDLVVMGTHGRRGIDRVIFGSVAERVLKSSPVPVMTVRPYVKKK